MPTLREHLSATWRVVPLGAKLAYAVCWALSAVMCSLFYRAAWASGVWSTVILPILMGAFWPITVTLFCVSIFWNPWD